MRSAILTHIGDGRIGTAKLDDLEKISVVLTLSRKFPNTAWNSKGEIR